LVLENIIKRQRQNRYFWILLRVLCQDDRVKLSLFKGISGPSFKIHWVVADHFEIINLFRLWVHLYFDVSCIDIGLAALKTYRNEILMLMAPSFGWYISIISFGFWDFAKPCDISAKMLSCWNVAKEIQQTLCELVQ
jgi:hypothetical protein